MVSRLLRLVKHYKTKGKQSPKHKKTLECEHEYEHRNLAWIHRSGNMTRHSRIAADRTRNE